MLPGTPNAVLIDNGRDSASGTRDRRPTRRPALEEGIWHTRAPAVVTSPTASRPRTWHPRSLPCRPRNQSRAPRLHSGLGSSRRWCRHGPALLGATDRLRAPVSRREPQGFRACRCIPSPLSRARRDKPCEEAATDAARRLSWVGAHPPPTVAGSDEEHSRRLTTEPIADFLDERFLVRL